MLTYYLLYQKCRCSNVCYCYLCFTKIADVPTFAIATFVLPKVPMFQLLLLLPLFYQKCRCSNVCYCYLCFTKSADVPKFAIANFVLPKVPMFQRLLLLLLLPRLSYFYTMFNICCEVDQVTIILRCYD